MMDGFPNESDRSARPTLLELARAAFEHRLARLALVVLVVLSLVPLSGAWDALLRPVFLVVFGGELLVRWRSWREQPHALGAAQIGLAVADVVAFISFLPIDALVGHEQAQLLALLRLTRLLMLLRFARALALDIYAIVTRREQLQQFGLVTGAVLFLAFVSAAILTQLAIPHDVDNPGSFIEQLWWSFRQIESPDNLVRTPRVNLVVLALSLGLTITGVFVISFVIGIGTNVVDQVVAAERRRPLHYRGHTLVSGPVHGSEILIREYVRIYAKNRQIPSPERLFTWLKHSNPLRSAKQFPRVALLGRREEPPPFLWEPLMRWVAYREGDPAEPASLDRVAAARAKRAILLARDELVHEADAVNIATLAAFRAKNAEAHVFVEVIDSDAVPLVKQVGGKGTFALDMPRLLGMLMCQHLLTPGMQRLYHDLLTADGSELYTHVYVDEGERAALRRLSSGTATVSFDALARFALARHGVHLIGVMLGGREASRAASGVVLVEGLVPWLNPHVVDPADATKLGALGARPGVVPLASLRGVVGFAESYLPLQAAAADIARGAWSGLADEHPVDAAIDALRAATTFQVPGTRHVAMIGASDALPSMLRELSRYVPGVEVTLFVSQRGGERVALTRRLEQLGVGFDARDPAPGADGRSFALERGGRITIYSHDGPDLSGFAARVLARIPPVEAAVFLSEPEGDERDARVAMRILRFARLLEEGKVPRGASLHVLAEFLSIEKGARIQGHLDPRSCGFTDASCMRLTLVSTDTIKNYFMVHSAFVPGVVDLYEMLLEERGQEIVRFTFTPPAHGPSTTTIRALQRALAPSGSIPFAVEMADERLFLAPPASYPLTVSDIRGVYAVSDQTYASRLPQRA
ncbi:MAG: hypothetical protein HYS27_02940 [Deltaproteobacteria bacterium]|nr:hypothetical protein [Deltaproteobacteria bacterium]